MAQSKRNYLLIILIFVLFVSAFQVIEARNLLSSDIMLLRMVKGHKEDEIIQLPLGAYEGRAPASLNWLYGDVLWHRGQKEEALCIWGHHPQYSAAMLEYKIKIGQDVNYQLSKTALMLDPYSIHLSEYISFYLLNRDEDLLAYNVFQKVYRQNPQNTIAMMVLVLTRLCDGKYCDITTSLELFDKALRHASDNSYVVRYGFRIMNKYSIGEARILKLIQAAKLLPSQDFELLFSTGQAYRLLGEYQDAQYYNLLALKSSPNHPWANLQQVEFLQNQNQSDVEPWLENALLFRVTSRPDYYRRLLKVLLDAGKVDNAQKIYCEATDDYGYPSGIFNEFLKDSEQTFVCN